MTEAERRRIFSEMYAQYDKRVLAYCIYVTGNRELANDIFQEIFVKAYKSLHTVREIDKASNWLFRIARNECLNAMKSIQRSQKRTVRLDDSEYMQKYGSHSESYSDEIEHLRWGITQLPNDYREALLLAEFEGYSMKEIAEITGTSISNVKVRIHRAKQRLHTILQPILNSYE